MRGRGVSIVARRMGGRGGQKGEAEYLREKGLVMVYVSCRGTKG